VSGFRGFREFRFLGRPVAQAVPVTDGSTSPEETTTLHGPPADMRRRSIKCGHSEVTLRSSPTMHDDDEFNEDATRHRDVWIDGFVFYSICTGLKRY